MLGLAIFGILMIISVFDEPELHLAIFAFVFIPIPRMGAYIVHAFDNENLFKINIYLLARILTTALIGILVIVFIITVQNNA